MHIYINPFLGIGTFMHNFDPSCFAALFAPAGIKCGLVTYSRFSDL